jgi:hypothetical protein
MNDYEYAAPTEQGGLSAFYAQLDRRKAQSAPAPQVDAAIDPNDNEYTDLTQSEDLPAMPESAYAPLSIVQKAYWEMADAEVKYEQSANGSAYYRSAAESAMKRAAQYAAIAQAQALTRIANALDILVQARKE